MRRTAIWILDWIEHGDGFADGRSSPEEQVRQLLGTPYKLLRRSPRKASYLLTVVLDLSRTFDFTELYEFLVTDLDAVGAYPTIVVGFPPGPAKLIARLSYLAVDDSSTSTPWAAHYAETTDAMPSFGEGALFDMLATWATLRDRHIPSALEAIVARVASHSRPSPIDGASGALF